MRRQILAWAMAGLLLLTGCSTKPAAPQPPSTPVQVEPGAPLADPPLPPAPTAENPPTDGQREVEVATSLQQFFAAYYQARTRGDEQAVRSMTGGAYQARAVSTLPEDKGVTFSDVQIQWWSGRPEEKEPAPTVVRTRGKLKMGIPFRVRPSGDTWQIVDLIDPATGRWLSEPAPKTVPWPADMTATLEQQVRTFYQARSIQYGVVDSSKLFPLTGGVYSPYLQNLTRQETRTLDQETYEVQGVKVLQWVPGDTQGQGRVDVQVTRKVTTVDKQGAKKITTGDSRLRLSLEPGPDGKPGWRVVDGFLTGEHAWVSGMAWSGMLVAA